MSDEFKKGDLAIWDTYYSQPNPLVVMDQDGEWTYLNLTDLLDLVWKESYAKLYKEYGAF